MKKLVSKILAISFLVASASAMAQERNGYIGGSFGFAKANIDCFGAPTCDKNGTIASAYGGYRFTPWFAGELRYLHAGPATLAGGGVSANSRPMASVWWRPFPRPSGPAPIGWPRPALG
jgi:OOP family OmpA-OmpF porin